MTTMTHFNFNTYTYIQTKFQEIESFVNLAVIRSSSSCGTNQSRCVFGHIVHIGSRKAQCDVQIFGGQVERGARFVERGAVKHSKDSDIRIAFFAPSAAAVHCAAHAKHAKEQLGVGATRLGRTLQR